MRSAEELKRRDGQEAEIVGRYCAVERPVRGVVRKPRPKDHALLMLDDGAQVYLEPFDSPASLFTLNLCACRFMAASAPSSNATQC